MSADPSAGEPAAKRPGARIWRVAAAVVKAVLAVGVALLAGGSLLGVYALVVWLRVPDAGEIGHAGDPGPTAFMAQDGCEAAERVFVPLADIDPRLSCTVVWAEDWRFFEHHGVDWRALEGAMRDNWRKKELRVGGSTIPMQLARNLFLSRARTPSRKLREIVLARRISSMYTRERVLELYLNAAEWGPCIYGVEAAAQHYFGHSARVVDAAEAALLSSILPRPNRPLARDRADRRRLVRRQEALLTLMGRAGLLSPASSRKARAEVFALIDRVARPGAQPDSHTPLAPAQAPSRWLSQACGTGFPESRWNH